MPEKNRFNLNIIFTVGKLCSNENFKWKLWLFQSNSNKTRIRIYQYIYFDDKTILLQIKSNQIYILKLPEQPRNIWTREHKVCRPSGVIAGLRVKVSHITLSMAIYKLVRMK